MSLWATAQVTYPCSQPCVLGQKITTLRNVTFLYFSKIKFKQTRVLPSPVLGAWAYVVLNHSRVGGGGRSLGPPVFPLYHCSLGYTWLQPTLVLSVCLLGTPGASERPPQLSFPLTTDMASTSHQISASACSQTLLPAPQVWEKSESLPGSGCCHPLKALLFALLSIMFSD